MSFTYTSSLSGAEIATALMDADARIFMRAGSGNTSRYIFQNTEDGLENGTPLLNDYQAIALSTTTGTDLERLLTDSDSADYWLLQGNEFDYEEAVSQLYKPWHKIRVDGYEFYPSPDVEAEDYAENPLSSLDRPNTGGGQRPPYRQINGSN